MNNTHFSAYTYLGSENIGQICICPKLSFIMLFLMTMLTSLFCCSFWLFYNKKNMFERMWRDDYLLYCNEYVLLEREFNYLLYGVLHVQIG